MSRVSKHFHFSMLVCLTRRHAVNRTHYAQWKLNLHIDAEAEVECCMAYGKTAHVWHIARLILIDRPASTTAYLKK